MAEQPGFFEQLIGSAQDEGAVADTLYAEQRRDSRTRTQALTERGVQQLSSGLLSLFGKKDTAAGVKDQFTAQANGITVNELQTRRLIRQETAGVKDDGTFESRRKMTDIAARIANEQGDSQSLARALSARQRLNEEETQFDKLKADKDISKAKAIDVQIQNAWKADGTPVTGMLGIENGSSGMHTEVNGELIFKPFDENFSQVEPDTDMDGIRPHEIANQLKINRGTDSIKRVTGLASSANTALAKTDRVLSTLTDLFEKGGVESVIGTSGKIITSVDNLFKNVRGVLNAFADESVGTVYVIRNGVRTREERTFAGRKGLAKFASDAASSFSELIKLPEGVERTSAAAQQHRAAVMEMAYMAARLAEPSNRGLSDNDIKNALARIAGDTSEPQVMMRRFLEMQVDAANELDFELRLMHGSLGPKVTDAQINMAVVGKGYAEYKKRKDAIFEKFGASVQPDGRVKFGEEFLIGTDVGPGEGTVSLPEEQINVTDMSNSDAASALGL